MMRLFLCTLLNRHAWRLRGPAVRCLRCSKSLPIYPLHMWSKSP